MFFCRALGPPFGCKWQVKHPELSKHGEIFGFNRIFGFRHAFLACNELGQSRTMMSHYFKSNSSLDAQKKASHNRLIIFFPDNFLQIWQHS